MDVDAGVPSTTGGGGVAVGAEVSLAGVSVVVEGFAFRCRLGLLGGGDSESCAKAADPIIASVSQSAGIVFIFIGQ